MSANDIQHGGTHYKANPIQPWDYILANDIGYMEGSAIKYLTRWKSKGGVQDLHKARHFIDRLIEEEEKKLQAKVQLDLQRIEAEYDRQHQKLRDEALFLSIRPA